MMVRWSLSLAHAEQRIRNTAIATMVLYGLNSIHPVKHISGREPRTGFTIQNGTRKAHPSQKTTIHNHVSLADRALWDHALYVRPGSAQQGHVLKKKGGR
jgi:hypothetical protein